MVGPFQVASTLGGLAAEALATVLGHDKLTQRLYILKEWARMGSLTDLRSRDCLYEKKCLM